MIWNSSAPAGGFSDAAPWLPVKAPQLAHEPERQLSDPDSIYHFYRRMLALRRTSRDLMQGATRWIETADPILTFQRGDSTICVFNLSNTDHIIDLNVATQHLAENAISLGHQISLGANGVWIGTVN